MFRSGLARFAFAHGVVCMVACGASQAAAPGTVHGETAIAPALRPVPADPLELIVGDPSAVVLADVGQVRGSALFARVRPLIESASCLSSAQLDALLGGSTRVVFATRRPADHADSVEWLAVLVGQYTAEDADRMLANAAQGAGTPVRQSLGRFTLTTQAELAASLLEPQKLVMGNAAWVQSVLAAIDHPVANFAASALWREHAPRVRCSERTLCVLSAADGVAGQRLQRALSSAGFRRFGQQLGAADTALGVSLAAGVEIALVAQLATPDVASSAAAQTKDLLWQAGLLTRLAGLPDVLDATRIAAEGNQLKLDLTVSEADLAAYEQRLAKLLGDHGEHCAAVAAP